MCFQPLFILCNPVGPDQSVLEKASALGRPTMPSFVNWMLLGIICSHIITASIQNFRFGSLKFQEFSVIGHFDNVKLPWKPPDFKNFSKSAITFWMRSLKKVNSSLGNWPEQRPSLRDQNQNFWTWAPIIWPQIIHYQQHSIHKNGHSGAPYSAFHIKEFSFLFLRTERRKCYPCVSW